MPTIWQAKHISLVIRKKKDFCRKPWTETFVNWNGDVFPYCCVHTEEKDRMGNIFEQDFEEIWNGENYVAARKEMLDQPNDLKTICHTCKKMSTICPNRSSFQKFTDIG